MEFWFLVAAAILSLAGMVFHGFIGARIYMGNVNDSDLPVHPRLCQWRFSS